MVKILQKNIKKISRYYPLVIILFIGVVIFCLSAIPLTRTTLTEATTIKPEAYTELYFENHLNLPSVIKPNQPYSFQFTIHNLENKEMTYPYEVYLQAGSLKMPINDTTITLKNNQYKTIQEGFSIDDPIFKSEIVVNLINKNQQIDFWIQSINPPVIKEIVTNSSKKTIIQKRPVTKSKSNVITPTSAVTRNPILIYVARQTAHTASTSATAKQYGGWYVHDGKAMVWLGTDSSGQDIWSNNLPQ
jgi:hypothetical protein